jgi:hypothetical protein
VSPRAVEFLQQHVRVLRKRIGRELLEVLPGEVLVRPELERVGPERHIGVAVRVDVEERPERGPHGLEGIERSSDWEKRNVMADRKDQRPAG